MGSSLAFNLLSLNQSPQMRHRQPGVPRQGQLGVRGSLGSSLAFNLLSPDQSPQMRHHRHVCRAGAVMLMPPSRHAANNEVSQTPNASPNDRLRFLHHATLITQGDDIFAQQVGVPNVGVEPLRRCLKPSVRAATRPRPLSWAEHQTSGHRVAFDVTAPRSSDTHLGQPGWL